MSSKNSKTIKAIGILTVILCVTVFVLYSVLQSADFFDLQANTQTEDYVKFIDVGQGDSILIYSNGYSALVDTGPMDSSLNLSKVLLESGVETVDVLILSHIHIDHTGGVAQVFKDFTVKNLIVPELSTFSEGIYSAQLAIDKVTRNGGGVYQGVQGMNFKLGDFEITVLASYHSIPDENNRSIVLMAEKDGRNFLLTGDSEVKAERRLIDDNLNLKCDVLKVAHHGSSTSTCLDFLEEADPQYAVISCGKDNEYGHPHIKILKRFENQGVTVYRTDKQGSITFFVDKGKIEIKGDNIG